MSIHAVLFKALCEIIWNRKEDTERTALAHYSKGSPELSTVKVNKEIDLVNKMTIHLKLFLTVLLTVLHKHVIFASCELRHR